VCRAFLCVLSFCGGRCIYHTFLLPLPLPPSLLLLLLLFLFALLLDTLSADMLASEAPFNANLVGAAAQHTSLLLLLLSLLFLLPNMLADMLAGEAPFNAIHVGAAADELHQVLLDKLAPGGRMVIPVGPHYSYQVGQCNTYGPQCFGCPCNSRCRGCRNAVL
jgi:hypothetical protein